MSRRHIILKLDKLVMHDNKYIHILEIAILFSLALIYLYFVLNYFLARPMPAGSDAMYYLTPAIWGNNIGTGSVTLIDRLVPLIGLRLSCLLVQPGFTAGAYYILLINLLIILTAVCWAYAKKGLFAGLFVGILLITSYSFLHNATNVYTDQTMSLFCLVAFIFFFSQYKNKIFDPSLMAGIFSAFACFSKLPGVVIFIFFIAWIIMGKQWPKLIRLFLGFAAGTVFTLLIYTLTYGFDSLQYIILHSRYSWEIFSVANSNQRSQYVFYAYQRYLPIFISLIIFLGAYINKTVKPLFFISIIFVAFSLVMALMIDWYALSDNYTYPLLIFTSVGTGIYLSTIFDNKQTGPLNKLSFFYQNRKFKLITALLCITGIIIAFTIGISYYATFANLSSPKINHLLFRIYPTIPLIMIGLMVLIEYYKSAFFTLLFILLVSLWCPAFNGATAYDSVSGMNTHSAVCYTAPPIFNEISAKRFSVYVENWNSNKVVYADIPRFYANFFNQKYIKVTDGDTYKNIMYRILMIKEQTDIQRAIEFGEQILTDTPDKIIKQFPSAVAVKEIPWESTRLYLMDLNIRKNIIYQSDFFSWKASGPIALEEFNKTATPLCIARYRGSFQFERLQSGPDNVIRITPIGTQSSEEKLLILSYTIKRNENNENYQYVTLCVNSKTSYSDKNFKEMSIFIQDNGTSKGFNGKELAVYEYSFTESSITKTISADANLIQVGIIFKPKSNQSWLEIKNMAIYDVSP